MAGCERENAVTYFETGHVFTNSFDITDNFMARRSGWVGVHRIRSVVQCVDITSAERQVGSSDQNSPRRHIWLGHVDELGFSTSDNLNRFHDVDTLLLRTCFFE